MDIDKMLKEAEEAYDDATDKIGQAIREQLLVPFCKRYEMGFDSGMGTWSLENELICIYRSGDWELGKIAKRAAKTDDEYETLTLKAKEFFGQPETQALVKALDATTMRGASLGCNINPYEEAVAMNNRKCACEGTGLIPPTSKLPKGGRQAYCPRHKCKRDWPQLQADGSVQYKELRADGQGLK